MIVTADCVEAMRDMAPDSIDAIVTDPPYGLGFMGKKWDALPPGLDFARAALRVLKPGGHILAFGGTRTVHRLTCALEDAGFEIRDCVHWLYYSGFPKSLDASKAIDAAAGAVRTRVPASGGLHNNANLNDDGWANIRNDAAMMDSSAPATEDARTWQGWGTGIKPSIEIIAMAQKPLDLQGFCATLARQIWRSACQLRSFVKGAGMSSRSSRSALGGAADSALWLAVEGSSTPAALYEAMATWLSASAIRSTSLNTVWSWLNTLVEISTRESTFTTETATSLTTVFQTLKSSTWPLTPACIVEGATLPSGTVSSAAAAAACFSVLGLRLGHIPPSTARERATSSPFADDLAPAIEPIILARKPLSERTVAANVLRWGTGALNIDACRFAYGDTAWPGPQDGWNGRVSQAVAGGVIFDRPGMTPEHDLGRFPANVYAAVKPSRAERDAGLGTSSEPSNCADCGKPTKKGDRVSVHNAHPT